jgi:hypothetical protein
MANAIARARDRTIVEVLFKLCYTQKDVITTIKEK